MTRPTQRNGFGLTTADAEGEVRVIEAGMSLLPDNAAAYHEWRKLVGQYGITGVQVHDARLAAVMYVHGVKDILTLNPADFARFTGLRVMDPAALVSR